MTFYSRRVAFWRSRMGMTTSSTVARSAGRCPLYLGHVLRLKAYGLRERFGRWWTYQYAWDRWLPSNWRSLAVCETSLNWEHSNSRFTSAFGISWAEYDADARHMGAPPWRVRHTPRDQYLAALGHYDRFGDGWSCPGP